MKKVFAMMLILAMVMTAGATMAEEFVAKEFAAEEQNALAAAKASLPDAVVDYTVRERDDGRWEWNLFFTQGEQLGICKVLEGSNEVFRVELFDKDAGALTASEAMAKLAEKKGAVTVTELDLDWDDGRLSYEGNAELDGKRYEFEMKVSGEIIEWERD